MLEMINTGYTLAGKKLVHNVSLQILPGEFVVVMGANGAGKSTLLKMMAGALKPTEGEVLFKEKPIGQYSTPELAKQRGVLSQQYHISFPMKAGEVVMMGRYPYFQTTPGRADKSIVAEMMEKLQVTVFADRDYHSLSGGEAQKIQLCRVLAQIAGGEQAGSRMLLLDEPVSHLDIKYQHQLLQEAKKLCSREVGVLAVLHDVNLALKYADRILFMKNGSILATLAQNEQVTSSLIRQIFEVEAKVYPIPDGDGNFVFYT